MAKRRGKADVVMNDIRDKLSTMNEYAYIGFDQAKEIAFGDLRAILESYSPDQLRTFQESVTAELGAPGTLLPNLSEDDVNILRAEILSVAEEIIDEKNRALERIEEERLIEALERDDEAPSPLSSGGRSSVTVSPFAASGGGSVGSSDDLLDPTVQQGSLVTIQDKMKYLESNRLAAELDRDGFEAAHSSDMSDIREGAYYSDKATMQVLTKLYLTDDRVVIGKPVRYQEGQGFGADSKSITQLTALVGAMSPGQVLIQPMLRVNESGRAPHWIGTVITKDSGGAVHITCADSMFNTKAPDGTVNRHEALETLSRALRVDSRNVHNISSYQQGNGSDCGAWLIENSSRITDHALKHGGQIRPYNHSCGCWINNNS